MECGLWTEGPHFSPVLPPYPTLLEHYGVESLLLGAKKKVLTRTNVLRGGEGEYAAFSQVLNFLTISAMKHFQMLVHYLFVNIFIWASNVFYSPFLIYI